MEKNKPIAILHQAVTTEEENLFLEIFSIILLYLYFILRRCTFSRRLYYLYLYCIVLMRSDASVRMFVDYYLDVYIILFLVGIV